MKRPIIELFAFLLVILANCIFLPLRLFAQEEKLKLAVLRISYDAFSQDEQTTVNEAFYDYLSQNDQLEVMAESEASERLISVGIRPSEISSEQGYITAGQVLQVDYVLIGNMDKIGDFVEVTFRTFKMPAGSQRRYPGGKTLDMLVKEELPSIVKLIYQDIGLEPEAIQIPLPIEEEKQPEPGPEIKPGGKPPWVLIALGGAGGVIAAVLLAGGGGGAGGDNGGGVVAGGLPRPPTVP